MEKNEESGSPGWSSSFFSQTTEDVARAVAAAAAAVRSPRPSVVYSSKDESGSPLKRLQLHVSRMMKGLSSPPAVQSGSYNPEILTSQKRQWANFQLQSLDHKVWKEPSKLFESMVVVGLPPSSDIQALQNLYFARKFEGSGRLRSAIGGQHQCRVEPNIEPQVLLVYPPEKQLPLKYKDLLSFCFPAGVEVNAVERTPSMSEFNEILLGQEHLKQSDLSFVFRLQVADASTLYGCCVLVEEFIQKPSGLISKMSDAPPLRSGLNRHVLTTRRCYCILSRLPFFELHFGVLNSIFNEERLEQLTKQISTMNLESPFGYGMIEMLEEKISTLPLENGAVCMLDEGVEASQSSDTFSGRVTDDKSHSEHQNERLEASQSSTSDTFSGRVTDDTSVHQNERVEASQSSTSGAIPERVTDDTSHSEHQEEIIEASQSSTSDTFSGRVTDDKSHSEHQNLNGDSYSHEGPDFNVVRPDPETEKLAFSREPAGETYMNDNFINRESGETPLLHAISPLLQNQQSGSSESSPSFSRPLREDRHFRTGVDEAEIEEASSSGRDIFCEQSDILEWVKANNHGSLQIIREYYQLDCPTRGSTIKFQPLDHLHPLEYYRHDETVLRFAGSAIDLRSCSTSLELAEAQSALMVEEEAAALSVWSIACLCGSLRLEHVLTFFAGALLEKQIVVVCSNLGVLSALVLSIIPLIRPYQWQSLLMPVLPNDMLDFLDAPVPYIVGVKNKTTEVQSKLTNVILVDANRNQVKSPTIPQLPQYRELYSCLRPYHEKLVGESFLGKKRPVYECTDVQAEAAKGFLGVLRSYLNSLCFNLRSHTITNVQSNDDKVSLLLKESFIESFHGCDRPFMKLFLETQLFSVHTDFVLSFFQKE